MPENMHKPSMLPTPIYFQYAPCFDAQHILSVFFTFCEFRTTVMHKWQNTFNIYDLTFHKSFALIQLYMSGMITSINSQLSWPHALYTSIWLTIIESVVLITFICLSAHYNLTYDIYIYIYWPYRSLAVSITRSGSIGKCTRLSQHTWLLVQYSHTYSYLLTYTIGVLLHYKNSYANAAG